MVAFLPIIILFSFDFIYLPFFYLLLQHGMGIFFRWFSWQEGTTFTSNLGSLLDLLADKILVSSILIYLFSFIQEIPSY